MIDQIDRQIIEALQEDARMPLKELAALGVVHTGLVYILLYGAIQKLPTSLSGALSFIYPAVAILVDVVALGHRLQAGQIVGMAMVLVAAAGAILGWAPIRQRFSRRA